MDMQEKIGPRPDVATPAPEEKRKVTDEVIYDQCLRMIDNNSFVSMVLLIGAITLLDQKMKAEKPELFWAFKSTLKSYIASLEKQAKELNEYVQKAV